MRKILFLLTAVIVVCGISGKASADITISYEYALDGTTLTSAQPGAIIDNFDSGRPGWTYTGNGHILSGDVSGVAAAPYNSVLGVDDNTNYLSIPQNSSVSPQSVTVDFGGNTYNYLGLFWGSMDTYNVLEFLNGGSVVVGGTFTGADVTLNGASGNQVSALDNAYVNFHGVPGFDAIRLTSSQYAFELDNLAVVPVPGAVLLGMLGLSIVGVKMRKHA